MKNVVVYVLFVCQRFIVFVTWCTLVVFGCLSSGFSAQKPVDTLFLTPEEQRRFDPSTSAKNQCDGVSSLRLTGILKDVSGVRWVVRLNNQDIRSTHPVPVNGWHVYAVYDDYIMVKNDQDQQVCLPLQEEVEMSISTINSQKT